MISTTELHQLLKLPFLVEHFIDHKKQNSSITFLEFLDKHYAKGKVVDEDYAEDMRLPFKSNQGCPEITIKAPVVSPFSSLLIKPLDISSKTFTLYNDMFLPSFFTPNIWQPPKYA